MEFWERWCKRGKKKFRILRVFVFLYMCQLKFYAINGKNMDVFKLDQSLNANLGNAPPPDKLNAAEVSFDTGTEFSLSFFDTPEDNTQGFSDPGSVGSTSVTSPSPDISSPQVATSTFPTVILQQASSSVISSPSPTSKQGKAMGRL